METRVKNINKIKHFIKNRESEYNDDKVSKDNAVWLPTVLPIIFLPVAFFIDYISVQSRASSYLFLFTVELAFLASILNIFSGIACKNKEIGTSKAFFAMRMYTSCFFSLVPICALVFVKFSNSNGTLDEKRMMGFIFLFIIMMIFTYIFVACTTVYMINRNRFKEGRGGWIHLSIWAFYVPLLVAGKIVGKSDNSYIGAVFLCMIMSAMVIKTAYYHIKLKYALKYNLESFLPQLDK